MAAKTKTFRFAKRKIRVLGTGRAWGYVNESGDIDFLPVSLRSLAVPHVKFTAAQREEFKSLRSLCAACKSEQTSSHSGCTNPSGGSKKKTDKNASSSQLISHFFSSPGAQTTTTGSQHAATLFGGQSSSAPAPSASTTISSSSPSTSHQPSAPATVLSSPPVAAASPVEESAVSPHASIQRAVHALLEKHKSTNSKRKVPFPNMGEFPVDELRLHPVAFSLAQCTMFNWDAYKACELYCPQFRFCCPNVGCGKALQCKGWGKNARIEQSNSPNACVVRFKEFGCTSCAPPQQKSWSSLDAALMDQLPKVVRGQFPFVCIPNGSLVSKATVMSIVCGATTNFAFEAMEKQGKEAITAVFLDAEMTRRDVFTSLSSSATLHAVPTVLPEGTVLDYVDCFALTAPVMKKLFLMHMFQQTPYAQKVFMLNSMETDVLCFDMVHFHGNKGSKEGVYGMWVVLGKFGAPICARTAMTKSLQDAKGMLKGIQDFGDKSTNFYSSACTDFPEADEQPVHEVLGELVKVIKDTFHLRKSLSDTTLDASKFTLGFEEALSGVFWSFSDVDIARDRAWRKLELGEDDKYLDKLYNSPSW
jgi:hypothetical protein